MPNTREKRSYLIDPREKLAHLIVSDLPKKDQLANAEAAGKLADHLIANGVTVQQWIPVTERLPDDEGLCLVAVVNDHERRYSKTAWYHGHGNWFLHQKVTHWMPLPEPPKGE